METVNTLGRYKDAVLESIIKELASDVYKRQVKDFAYKLNLEEMKALRAKLDASLDESRYESYSYTMRAQVNFNRIFLSLIHILDCFISVSSLLLSVLVSVHKS